MNNFLPGAHMRVCLIIFMFPLVLFAQNLNSPFAGRTNEITGRRDMNSKHFRNADGSISMFTVAGPIHYKAIDGTWQEINTSLDQTSHGYINKTNTVSTFFPLNLNKDGHTAQTSQGLVTEMLSPSWYYKGTEWSGAFNFLKPVVQNNIIVYPSAEGVQLRYTIEASRKKMDWIIANRSFLNTAPASSNTLVFTEDVVIPAGSVFTKTGDELTVFLKNGDRLLSYERPIIHEEGKLILPEDGDEAVYGRYEVIQLSENRFRIETHVPMKWLTDASRKFPVVVDPTTNYYPDNAANWTGYQTSAASKTSGFIRVTNLLNVGWAKFNISSIPPAATINQTQLYSNHYTTTGTKETRVNDMNNIDPVSATSTAISNEIAANDAYISNFPFGGTTFGWRTAVLGASANTDVKNRISRGWTAIGYNYVSGSTTFMYHYGFNAASSANRPYLQITYVDAIVDLSVDAVVTPSNNSCGTPNSVIILRIKNNSASQNITGAQVVCNLSGGVTQNSTTILNRTLNAGAMDTVHLPVVFDWRNGATFTLRAYTDYINDPNHLNDTLNQNFFIHPIPAGVTFTKSTASQGTHSVGFISSPDHVKAGDSLVYEISAPSGYTNSQYGTDWQVSGVTVRTLAGTNLSTYYTVAGSSTSSAMFVVKPNSSETDSVFEINFTIQFTTTGCSRVYTRYMFVAPVAVPGFESTLACHTFPVNFRDTSRISSGSMTYFWDFGDVGNGDTSVVKDPSYVFSAPGMYTVTLTVKSDLGYATQLTKQVEVGYNPQTSFTADNACYNTSIQFTNATTIPGNLTLSYEWDLGDGTTSTQVNPVKLYAAPGVYTAILKSRSAIGCEATFTRQVTVAPYPSAAFSVHDACANEEVAFVNSTTISFGTTGQEWTFGDGNSSNVSSPLHRFNTPGNYSVKLKVISDLGCIDSVEKQLVIHTKPVAAFSAPNVCLGQALSIVNTSLLSGGSSGFNSHWNFGDGDTLTSNATNLTHIYGQAGMYTVVLKTSSQYCSSSISKEIEVKPAPEANFITNGSTCINMDIGIQNTSSGATQYNWTFGDNTSSVSRQPGKIFTQAGTYQVKLVATGNNGCADSASTSLTVNPAPEASFTFVRNVPTEQRQISLAPTVSGLYSYEWNTGDGNIYNQVAPVHSYLSNGPFIVMLKTTDINGCQNTTSQVISFNVSAKSIGDMSIEIYPNPASNELRLVHKYGEFKNVRLYNLLGQEYDVVYHVVDTETIELALDNVEQGIYYIQLTSDKGVFTERFVVNK